MDDLERLVNQLLEEDEILRERLAGCPEPLRESGSRGGSLGMKETLGHLAFWDTFAVRFFTAKLSAEAERRPPAPMNFEQRSREELERVRRLPFEEVLELYRQATERLVRFLRKNWSQLDEKERRDFQIPLKHRRHHRILLDRARQRLEERGSPGEMEGEA